MESTKTAERATFREGTTDDERAKVSEGTKKA